MLLENPNTPLKESSRVVLETERLVLRKPTLADVKAIASLANDRRVVQNTSRLPHPYTSGDAENFVKMVAEQKRDTTFLITRDGQALGMAGLGIGEQDPPEIGYWLGVKHWGQGYATEAARAVIDYAFEEFDCEELRAGARVINAESRRVLEKCGFQWTGVELRRVLSIGSSTPVDRFKLDRRIWASLRAWKSAARN